MDLGICERWKIRVPDEAKGWFLDWVLREPETVSRHLTAGFRAYLSLQSVYGPGELRTVREYFGGLGAQTLMIQDGIRPLDHTVMDNSGHAVAFLRQGLQHRPVMVEHRDSYAPESYSRADLVGLDFGDLTAWRLRPGERQRELLDRVMAGRPKAVVLTDIAGPRLHLHRDRYAEVLRTPDYAPLRSYAGYLEALACWLRAHYGYTVHRGYYHRWSAVLALVPIAEGVLAEPDIRLVPDEPKGLVIL